MSVFEVTKPKMEEEKKKPLEFQQTTVTLKFKALAGITKVSSKPQEPNDSANPSVKAVVTYRRNTIASNRFVSTHVPSLPIFCEQTPDTSNSKVYASWLGWKDDDLRVTDTNDSALQFSSVSFTRTVRRARNYDDLSKQGTVGGEPAIKKPNAKDSKKFLSSLSKAFAPELLDLKIGLMSGSNELIPLGVATVVIPGECKRVELDIPVVRNHSAVSEALTKKKKAMAKPKDHVHFSNDKDTVYKVDEGAFLRLELNIEPAPTMPPLAQSRDTNHTNIQKPILTGTGPINQALKRRRKMDRLMSQTKRLPLHQRAQLYLELRSRKKNNTYKKLAANSHEVDITRQSEVSEVTCGVSSAAVDVDELEDDDESVPASALALVIDQYQTDLNKHESDLETVNEQQSSNSMVASKAETKSIVTEMNQDPSVGKADDTSIKEKEEEEASAVPISIGSLMENTSRNGKESPAHDTHNDSSVSDFSTEFSSSLYSVFSTDHPQRATIAQEMMNILSCDPNLALTEEERAACKHYAFENEEYKYACCLPIVEEDDDVSIADDTITCHDDNTLASLESGLSLNGYKK